MSNKRQDIYRGHKEKGMWWLDEFEHIYTCWANHRNNWSKAKAFEKRYAKRRMRQSQKDEIQQELEGMDNDD